MTIRLVVWDLPEGPPDPSGEVLYWRSYARSGGASVPRYLEDHAERLRAEYLAFIHDLGQSVIKGKRLVEHLALSDGFSFWWMTQLAEKSPLKSPRIYTCLRLLALEEMLRERKPSELSLVTADRDLAQAVERLCRNLQIEFEWNRPSGPPRGWSIRRVFAALPYRVQGWISFFRNLAFQRPLRSLSKPRWASGESAVFVCSYFAHLDAASCARGDFSSRLWGALPSKLSAAGRRANWIHHFLIGREVPDARTGLDWLSRFNADPDRQGRHAFLGAYLSWGVALRSARSLLRLGAVGRRLGGIEEAFSPKGSAVWLWPVLRDDWRASLDGPAAASNCLWVELFDAALRDIPTQTRGLYLWENQGWEKALLRAWRKNGHGRIIGVQHATVPFWHLYSFEDPRSFARDGACPMPLPDRLAVNGPTAHDALAGSGYPADALVEVEALRYLDLRPKRARARAAGEVKVIVLGDIVPATARNLLSMLEGVIKRLPPGYRFAFKPHPAQPIGLGGYPGLAGVEQTTTPLGRALGEFDVALAGNTTSAAVDADQAGLPVIVAIDGGDLNLSPLRGRPGARFVSTPQDLEDALRAAGRAADEESSRAGFFFLDPELPRWRRLLSILRPADERA